MKTTFFSLVQATFHSRQSPPEQQKCKTKKLSANQHRTVIVGNYTESWSS